jgi:hypothetical protein
MILAIFFRHLVKTKNNLIPNALICSEYLTGSVTS